MAVSFPSYSGTPWYDFRMYSDYPWSEYHNTDVGTPVDVPLTAPLGGKITSISNNHPWGGQVTWQVDNPGAIGGHPYAFMIHLDAVNPNLHVGSQIAQGAFLGYSGGQTSNAGLKPLPAGLQHHATSPSHSTGPHLDIGVADSPRGSIDVSKNWSDALVNLARKLRINSNTNTGTGDTGIFKSNPGTKQQWAVDLLHDLGNPNPDQAQIEFISAWEHAESGSSGGALNNPLNTTKTGIPGATPFNTFGDQGQYHVWNYPSYAVGMQAEADVLQLHYYTPLLQALQTPGAASDAALGVSTGKPSSGVISSLETWGTSDWPTIYPNLQTAGSESINTSGTPPQSTITPQSSPCDFCNSLPVESRPVYCAFCGTVSAINGTVGDALSHILPTWLTTPPWQNPDLLHALGRGSFMILGGLFVLAGGIVAITGAAEKSGIPQKTQQLTKRIGTAIATEGASEAGRAISKKSAKKETRKPPAAKKAPGKKPPTPEQIRK